MQAEDLGEADSEEACPPWPVQSLGVVPLEWGLRLDREE